MHAARTAVLLVLLAPAGCGDDARMEQDGGERSEDAVGIDETECWSLGYDPEAATVAPSDGDISLEELKQRVSTARNELGL